MREQVCIVLNEREPEKAALAGRLQSILSEHGIKSQRPEIGPDIENQIILYNPQILVIDYLLGDFSTGLDVLARINQASADKKPKVIFLTDEPGVQVAVDAIKAGATDYFSIDDAKALEKVVQCIRNTIREKKSRAARPAPLISDFCIENLVAQSSLSRAIKTQAQTLVFKRSPVILISGPNGCGKGTLAHAIKATRSQEFPGQSTLTNTLDLSTFIGDLAQQLGFVETHLGPKLGNDLSLIVTHAECDNGELLEMLSARLPTAWSNDPEATQASYLYVCSSDPQSTLAWKKIFPLAEHLEIAPLKERREDIQPLVLSFSAQASKLCNLKLPALELEEINFLTSQDWPGETRQLRAIVIDSLIGAAHSEQPFIESAKERLLLWQEEVRVSKLAQAEQGPLNGLKAAMALEIFGHNYRAAAARLGCTPNALYKILHSKRGK